MLVSKGKGLSFPQLPHKDEGRALKVVPLLGHLGEQLEEVRGGKYLQVSHRPADCCSKMKEAAIPPPRTSTINTAQLVVEQLDSSVVRVHVADCQSSHCRLNSSQQTKTAVDVFPISFDLVEVGRLLSLFCIFSFEQHRLCKITALEF